MEHTLRCNSLKCRKELSDHAVVTTCSHIFCIECSNQLQLQLSAQQGRRPVCPACDAQLMNPDDVVVTNLNPTEDYKTSVLSGLNPNVIMECAGRALSFWAYQTTQEIVYQEYLARSLTDKYNNLNTHLDKIIRDANSELTNMRNKLLAMQADQDSFRRKNEELAQALREKIRKHLQTQELYDKLKRRAMLGQVQNAAFDAVDHTIQASAAANRYQDRIDNQNPSNVAPPPLYTNQKPTSMPHVDTNSSATGSVPPAVHSGNVIGNWAGFSSQASSRNQPVQTPSTHRQRLGNPLGPPPIPNNYQQQSAISRTPLQHQRPSPRQPLAPRTGNSPAASGFAGYGMSAGLKVSNPTGSVVNGMARPVQRTRVAQRPSSAFAGQVAGTFGSTSTGNMFSIPSGGTYY